MIPLAYKHAAQENEIYACVSSNPSFSPMDPSGFRFSKSVLPAHDAIYKNYHINNL